MLATAEIFEFEEFRLDRQGDGLSRRDERGLFVPVSIGSRALDILSVLVERPGELVTKEEIIAAVWRRTVVENANLTVQIAALRRILDQGRPEESCIQTVAARGYRFLPAVTRVEHATAPPTASHEAAALHATVAVPDTGPGRDRTRLAAIAAAVSITIIIAAGVSWWVWPVTRSPTASIPIALSTPQPVAPRLSIAVLPFADLSEGGGQQYFAEGITDDLTTDLSRIGGMFVISRSTAFTYRDKPVDTKQIGRELGVGYVLEGSVRRSSNKVRVNAQLIDAATDTHLWAEQFDRDTGDLLALQSEITSRIANALNVELIAAEAARRTEHPDALDYIFRGRSVLDGPPTRENLTKVMGFFERALELDPGNVETQSWLAMGLVERVLDDMTDSRAADLERAEGLIGQALAASPRSPLAHYAKAQLLRAKRRCEEAIPEYETALASRRNWAAAIAHIGRCKVYVGPIEEAIPQLEQAIRLSPLDPGIGLWLFRIGEAHLVQSHIGEAIVWLEKGRSAVPELAYAHGLLASAYALNGETERSAAELAEARRLSPDGRYSSIARLKARLRNPGVPKIRALFEATYYAGLRKAGVPEE